MPRRVPRPALVVLAGLGLAGCVYADPVAPRPAYYAPPPAPIVAAPPPVYAAPPPTVIVRPIPRRVWVPGQYGPYGRWIPGHWRYV